MSAHVTRAGDGNPVEGLTEKWSGDADFEADAPKENTTSMSIADADGNMICLTQSLGSAYGAEVMIGRRDPEQFSELDRLESDVT